MKESAYALDHPRREIVVRAIVDVCEFRRWRLLAAHVRENHVHVLVDADSDPDRIAIDFKSYASRALNFSGLDGNRTRRWTRHASTRRLYGPDAVTRAVRYVISGQGEPMSIYVMPERTP
jgi:REP element-mobilizing transposase RayT